MLFGRKKPEKIKKTKGEIAREYILKAIFITIGAFGTRLPERKRQQVDGTY